VLRLSGGDYAAGELLDCDQTGVLRWRSPAFARPLDFALGAVSSVSFPTRAAGSRPAGPYGLELAGGDVLFGALVGLDARQAELDAPGLGRLHVQRSTVERIVNCREGSAPIYVGPNGLSEWKETSPGGAWGQEAGQLFTARDGATLFGDFGIPAQAWIEFELSWRSEPDFELVLGAGPKPGDRPFQLEVWDRQLVLVRETKDKADLAALQNVAAGAGRCHFRVYLDQERGRAIVFGAEGTLLADVTVADAHARPGSGLRLRNHHGNVRLEQLRITHWSGHVPSEVQAGKSRIHRSDGSIVYAEIKAFDAAGKEFVVVRDGRETRVAADAVESVVLSPSGGPPACRVRAVCRDGTRLSGDLSNVQDGRLWLSRLAIAEPLGLRTADLQMLVVLDAGTLPPVGPEVVQPRSDVRRSTAALGGTPSSPVAAPAAAAGRSGRLDADGLNLHGCLMDGREQAGVSCLVWRPRGSLTGSPLKPGVSARVVYRDSPPPSPPPPQPQTPRFVFGMAVRVGAVAGPVAVAAESNPSYNATPTPAPRLGPALYLRCGDTIPCTVKRIDERGVAFESRLFDVKSIAHDKIKALDLEHPSRATKIDAEKRDRLLTLPRAQRGSPATHLIRSTEGDYLRARLIEMDDKTLTVEVRMETRHLPRQQVARIIWLDADPSDRGGKPPAAAAPPAATRVQALRNDGIRLTFFAESLAGATLRGASDVLGTCRVQLDDLDQLIVGSAIEKAARDLPYQRWKLQPAADPKFVTAGQPGGPSPGTESALVGRPAPDFELETLDGSRFRLSRHRGRIVVLDFWASWCGPCAQSLPQVVRTVEKFRDRNVILVAVNIQETPQAVHAALARLGLKANSALDRDGDVAANYAAVAIPQTVVIGADGKVARLFIGGGPQYAEQLRAALQAAVTPPSGPGRSP
jgi:peroxiredoxin